jgi:hypothetical protein
MHLQGMTDKCSLHGVFEHELQGPWKKSLRERGRDVLPASWSTHCLSVDTRLYMKYHALPWSLDWPSGSARLATATTRVRSPWLNVWWNTNLFCGRHIWGLISSNSNASVAKTLCCVTHCAVETIGGRLSTWSSSGSEPFFKYRTCKIMYSQKCHFLLQ